MDIKNKQTEMDEAFGKALKACRKLKSKTQEDFSLVSSRTYISQIERGLRAPTLKKIQALAEVLDIEAVTIIILSFLILDNDLSTSELLDKVQDELDLLQNE